MNWEDSIIMNEEQNIEIRSEEVQDILGTPPGWIIRRGVGMISVVVFILLAGSFIFKYPDIIVGKVTIVSENPPATIAARASGRISHLLVKDQQGVSEGTILAILENPAYYEDVFTLGRHLDSLRGYFSDPSVFTNMQIDDNLILGQVQPAWAAFVTQAAEINTFYRYDVFMARVETLRRKMADQEKYLQQLVNQARILDDQMELSKRQYDRDAELARQKVIPESELEKSQSVFLNNELNHRTSIANITQTRNEISQMQRQITELQTEKGEQINRLMSGLLEKYNNVINEIAAWKLAFVMQTPIAGNVTFTRIWSENQQVLEGTPVFTVVPHESNNIIGRVEIPAAGSGKVEIGQKVKIKLENYPHLEYGMLDGQVKMISLVPVQTEAGLVYTAEISLPSGLTTNYGIDLSFNQEMAGSAEIITKDRKLIERLVQPLSSLVRERILTN